MKKDKMYRPERDGAKNPVTPGAMNKPVPVGGKPSPMAPTNKPVPVGGKPSPVAPSNGRPPAMNKPVPVGAVRPTMPVVRPTKPGDRPSLPTLAPSQGQATMEALKRKQDEMAKAAALKKKKSGK